MSKTKTNNYYNTNTNYNKPINKYPVSASNRKSTDADNSNSKHKYTTIN